MYRWLELYERKHAELLRAIERYRRDSEVWARLGDRDEERGEQLKGAVAYARMQAAMYKRLQHNATRIFKNADGAHADWVGATTFDELVVKIDSWRDMVFTWMDEMVCLMMMKGKNIDDDLGRIQGVQRCYATAVQGHTDVIARISCSRA